MYMSAMKGKCLNMLHIYRDKLWSLGDQSIPLPHIEKPVQQSQSVEPAFEEPAATTEDKVEGDETVSQLSELNLDDKKTSAQDADDSNEECSGAEGVDHEKILIDAFVVAVKYKSKEFKLPIIVSTFVKIMQSCW